MSTQKAIAVTKKHLDGLGSPLAVIADAAVGQQLVTKFAQMYRVPVDEAKRFYEREKDNFSKLISQSDNLRDCTPMSIYLAFGKVMGLKLTFDNGRAPLVYLIPGSRNIGTKDNQKWIKEVVAQPSPDGEKEIRINNGILKKVSQPIIVHKGDIFKERFDFEKNEVYVTEFERLDKSNEIIASFIILTEPDGHIVHKVFKPIDWNRWKAASAKKNRGVANALYTSGIDGQIDESFLKGKTTLHSFKGYKQVDFAYSAPAGFVPDTAAALEINGGNLVEVFDDAVYDDQTTQELPEAAKDDFDTAVEEVIEEKQKDKDGISVDSNIDPDDPFAN